MFISVGLYFFILRDCAGHILYIFYNIDLSDLPNNICSCCEIQCIDNTFNFHCLSMIC